METSFLDKTLSFETGKVARQAHGAVMLRLGDLVILATAVSPDERREGLDFFPLTVDYRERFTSVGKFPGGYIKRESRPTEKEILTMKWNMATTTQGPCQAMEHLWQPIY